MKKGEILSAMILLATNAHAGQFDKGYLSRPGTHSGPGHSLKNFISAPLL